MVAFSLPGAWPSTESLEETNTHAELLSKNKAVPRRAFVNPAGDQSIRNSVASVTTNDEDSDDFYSFIEPEEDEESTLLSHTNPLSVDPIKFQNDCAITESASDRMEDATSSDEYPSSLGLSAVALGSTSSPASEESNRTPNSDYKFSQFQRTFLKPLAENVGVIPRTSTIESSSPRQSVNSESLSRFGDEESSHHLDHSEDESALSYTRVYNQIDQLDYTNNSEESLSPHHSTPHRVRRSVQAPLYIESQESQLDIGHLSQPDGDNPWTLSLEPALINLPEFGTGSRTSMSVESSSVTHDVAPVAPPLPRMQTPTPVPARLETPVPPPLPRQSLPLSHNEQRPRVGLGRPSVDLHPNALLSFYGGHADANPFPKNDAAKKTRSLYQKMKKFFTPKSKKGDRGISNDNPRTDSSSRSPFSSPYANESSSQWSLHRRVFQRSAKSSAPSVAMSCTPDIPYNPIHYPPSITQEGRHTFEYHRSQTAEDTIPDTNYSTKQNRRFSVPTRAPGSSSRPGVSSSRNVSVPSSRPQGKRWSMSFRTGN